MARSVTIKDVAREAGVSPMTVSRVLNSRPDVSPKTRRHVQNVIDAMGYAPNEMARSLSQGRSHTLGVVTSALEFFGPSRTLVGIEQRANELGFSLMVKLLHNPLQSRGENALNDLLANHVAGIIWAIAEIGDRRNWLYDQLPNESTPIVFINMSPRPPITLVDVDNRWGARLATQHLVEQGYEQIGIITGPPEWWEAYEREAGWREVLQEIGRNNLDRLKAQGDWTAASGHRAMISLIERAPEIDAVFVCNDSMALGALQAADSIGRPVPESLAVVGFDDIPESAFFIPPLTTVRQDLLEVGRQAVSQLYRQLEAQRREEAISPAETIIQPELIIRHSSLKVAS